MNKQSIVFAAISMSTGLLAVCSNIAMASAVGPIAVAGDPNAVVNPNGNAVDPNIAGQGLVVGNVNQVPFVVRSAVYGIKSQGDQVGAFVVLSDQPNYCDLVTRQVAVKNSKTMTVQPFITDSNNNKYPTLQTGDFNVLLPQTKAPGDVASVLVAQLDDSCHDVANHAITDASAGRVTVVSVQAPNIIGDPNFVGRATGVFDAQEPNQLTRFGGAYTAVYCPALTQTAAATPTCQ